MFPILVQLVTRLSMKRGVGPRGEPGATVDCLPAYLVILGSVAYYVYVHLSSRRRRT